MTKRAVKRALDIVLASTGLVVLAPVVLGLAVAIRLNMGSPVVFSQLRPGLHGRPFRIYKLRTMRHPTMRDGIPVEGEIRTTRLGYLLRRTSLDEIPELWNVLKGEMSIVGPRPLIMDYLPLYTSEQNRRHEVRPGMTGLAQIQGRHLLPWEERFQLDVWYVDNWTIRMDLSIMAATVRKVLSGSGIPPRGTADYRFTGSEAQPSADAGGTDVQPASADPSPDGDQESPAQA
jgi:lipopolysaccharide/colanic/teichoic acid biosynthesis glycosyltransferase